MSEFVMAAVVYPACALAVIFAALACAYGFVRWIEWMDERR